jgi:hypothetical protein
VNADDLAREGALERELHRHYVAWADLASEAQDVRLALRIESALDTSRPATTPLLPRLAAVAAVVALAATGMLLPRLLPATGPGPSMPVSGPSRTASVGFDPTRALDARVDLAGRIRTGGLWAVQADYLLISTDEGSSWKAGTLRGQPWAVDVADASHAWAVYPAADATPTAVNGGASLPTRMLVDRTTDGGRSWSSASVNTGGCASTSLSFVDARIGFLTCRGPQLAEGDTATTVILRTVDGGATWNREGTSDRLGSNIVASDADTLWAQPQSGWAPPVSLMTSDDAGATWSVLPFVAPETIDDPSQNLDSTTMTSIWWSGREGAFAVSMSWVGRSLAPRTWFFRTEDAGETWTSTRFVRTMPIMGASYGADAMVGPVWGILGSTNLTSLDLSSDLGATWAQVSPSGVPSNQLWRWMAFGDATHGAARIFVNEGHTDVLLLTADGGRTWQPADFSSARAAVSAAPASDAETAARLAADFQTDATKDPRAAWEMLSPFSQAAYGSESAFESGEMQRAAANGFQFSMGSASGAEIDLNPQVIGSAVWSDLQANAILSRAFVVSITFPDSPARRIVVAPCALTGAWRVWVPDAGSSPPPTAPGSGSSAR